ncbi:MAG: phosphate signaling complex protein PhoU [Candidatus Omnitrophica bacterium]|nr:phosphate signaling complex protein PhoU [Candidatus Omnitrophota bacterium]
MERFFDKELEQLYRKLKDMAELVKNSIQNSIDSLKSKDQKLAQKVIDEDRFIDELEISIDEACLELIARRQPVAYDLRFITMVMKITTDLERIADLSVDIAQRVLELLDKPLLKPLIDIPKLSELAQRMVKSAIDSFINQDTHLAKEVCLSDDEVDKLRDLIQDELIYDYMVKDSSTVPRAIPLLLIARHLERICDHATNIAEDIIYMIQAKIVKHHREKLENNNDKK